MANNAGNGNDAVRLDADRFDNAVNHMENTENVDVNEMDGGAWGGGSSWVKYEPLNINSQSQDIKPCEYIEEIPAKNLAQNKGTIFIYRNPSSTNNCC